MHSTVSPQLSLAQACLFLRPLPFPCFPLGNSNLSCTKRPSSPFLSPTTSHASKKATTWYVTSLQLIPTSTDTLELSATLSPDAPLDLVALVRSTHRETRPASSRPRTFVIFRRTPTVSQLLNVHCKGHKRADTGSGGAVRVHWSRLMACSIVGKLPQLHKSIIMLLASLKAPHNETEPKLTSLI